jgi:hypothetical protein
MSKIRATAVGLFLAGLMALAPAGAASLHRSKAAAAADAIGRAGPYYGAPYYGGPYYGYDAAYGGPWYGDHAAFWGGPYWAIHRRAWAKEIGGWWW